MRQGSFDGIRIGTGSVSADDFNFLVILQPGQDRFSSAVWQEIEWLAALKVDQNGSVAVPAPDGEIIHPQHPYRFIGKGRDGTQATQQGRGLDLHPQSWSQALTYLSTGGEPQGFQLFQETIAHPCPGLNQIGKAFGKNFSWACRCEASQTCAHRAEAPRCGLHMAHRGPCAGTDNGRGLRDSHTQDSGRKAVWRSLLP